MTWADDHGTAHYWDYPEPGVRRTLCGHDVGNPAALPTRGVRDGCPQCVHVLIDIYARNHLCVPDCRHV